MKKLILLVLFLPIIMPAQNAGESGFSFLKIGMSARNLAMSDFGIVGVNDVGSVIYNPAVLTSLEKKQIQIGHNSWIQDLSSENLSASFDLLSLPFALNVNTTSISNIEIRTKPSDTPEGKFDAHYFYTALSTGFNITSQAGAGVSVKYVYENLYSDESNGLAFDFGLMYKNIIEQLDLAASLRNLGSVDELRNVETKLPSDLRIGGAYNIFLSNIGSRLIIIGGFQKYLNVSDTHFHSAAEFNYNDIVSIRFGYVSGYDARDISAGLGIKWDSMNFDYAFTNFNFSLGSAHTISLMYTFN
ncbi:MAG: PorV/PorQ family protein [Melioribacteraceae bacterium]|nr:PorV/PorQ family protein [Melioribacteraceae bacterium]